MTQLSRIVPQTPKTPSLTANSRSTQPATLKTVGVRIRIVAPDTSSLELVVSKFMGGGRGDAYLEARGSLAFVAYDAAQLAGWCWGYQLIRPGDSSMLYLHQLEVDQAYRRQGIGRDLLRALMTAGVEEGATKMFLTTGAENTAARSLYDAMGGGLAAQGPTVNC